jgi:hypothetical protein
MMSVGDILLQLVKDEPILGLVIGLIAAVYWRTAAKILLGLMLGLLLIGFAVVWSA